MYDEKKSIRFAANLWKMALFAASNEGRIFVPTIKEFLLGELVAAMYEQCTGKESLMLFRRNGWGREMYLHDEWHYRIIRRMNNLVRRYPNVFAETPMRELAEFVRLNWSHAGHCDDGGHVCDMYNHCTTYMSSSRPTTSLYREQDKEIEAYFCDQGFQGEYVQWVEVCKRLGEMMHKHVVADLQFIKEHYHW